jgi:2-hydroxychromene-2-carboxylate isomerase
VIAERKSVDWYFDVISPFAYLQSEQLDAIAQHVDIQFKPVLFAGLLNHFANVGPAEIEPKRRFTFERIAWLAHSRNIPVVMPPAHPFNSLPLLRFVIAAGCTRDAMHAAFRFVWQQGKAPQDEAALTELLKQFSLPADTLNSDAVKQQLRSHGESAIAAGVFGVPSTVVDGRVFWGEDSTDMLLAYLRGDAFFTSPLMQAAMQLPSGIQRKRP